MNRIYRIVFNRTLGLFQVAAETRSYLAERGIDTGAEQETKTKRALEFFTRQVVA